MLQETFQHLFEGERSIPPMCPWYDHQVKYGMPNLKWCEETLCSYVVEPANTWSNIAYLIVALLIFWKATQKSQKEAVWIAPALAITGMCSFYYHMTTNGFSQYIDFIGMYIMVALLACFNLVRARLLKMKHILIPWLGLIVAYSGLYFLFAKIGIKIQLIIVLAAIVIVGTEFFIKFKLQQKTNYKNLYLALGFIGTAEVFSLLDLNRIMCEPSNHFIQGHAIWHVLGGIGFWFVYEFYAQTRLNEA